MTRIIGGRAGGRSLATPRGPATRPTSDRVREALFSILQARAEIEGAQVLDLYAGSGALGLEAASRGARRVDLVEQDRAAARLIAQNARRLGLAEEVHVHAMAVRSFAARPAPGPADLVLADPPYPMSEGDVAADLGALAAGEWMGPETTLVLERSRRSPEPAWPTGWERLELRTYGDTTLWFVLGGAGPGQDQLTAPPDC